MNKQIISLLIIFLFFGNTMGHAVHFLDKFNQKEYSWGDKLGRGALNIITSPVEVARQIQITSSEQSLLAGWTLGLIGGLGQGILRFGAGVLDLVTFPFNFPNSRKAPLIEPEFVWQKEGPKYA